MAMTTLDPQRSTVAQVWHFKGDAHEYEALLHRTARAFPRATPVMFCWGLDVFTKTPWWVVPLFWVPLSLSVMTTGVNELGASPWAVVAGIAVWPVLEYIMHRWVFHAIPGNRVTRMLLYAMHGMHHAFPGDRYRLVLPLTLSIPWAFLYLLACALVVSTPVALVFTAGTALAYTGYDVQHYVIHHMRSVRRWRLFAAAKRRHINQHHMGNWDANYGITSGAIDAIARHTEGITVQFYWKAPVCDSR